jgi:hypothetical protein
VTAVDEGADGVALPGALVAFDVVVDAEALEGPDVGEDPPTCEELELEPPLDPDAPLELAPPPDGAGEAGDTG